MTKGEHLKIGELPDNLVTPGLSAIAQSLSNISIKELELEVPRLTFLTGSSNPALANSIGQLLSKKVIYPIAKFDDGEVGARIPNDLTRHKVVIIQSARPRHVNTDLMELYVMMDATKRGGPDEMIVVEPYMSYSRQDRKEQSGTGITASLVADQMTVAGEKKFMRFMTVDLHADQEGGFFNIPVDILYSSIVMIPEIKQRELLLGVDYQIASPDIGYYKKAIAIAKRKNGENNGHIISFRKERDQEQNGRSHIVGVEGNVKGKDILLVDDEYASGETLDNCADWAIAHGAKSVSAAVTHGKFLGRKIDKKYIDPITVLNQSSLRHIFVTDTIELPPKILKHPKIQVVSVAPLLAEAIYRNLIGIPLADLVK